MPRRSTHGLVAMLVVTGSSTLSYSVCFPTLALFLAQVGSRDSGSGEAAATLGSSSELGWAVGVYSAAKTIFAPLVGRVVDRIGIRFSLMLLSLLLVAGSLLYAFAESSAFIIVARVVIGVASTSSTPCRAFIATGGHSKEVKARLNAWVGAASTFGFIVGPAVGGLLGLLPDHSLASRYRAAGWFGALLGLASLLAVLLSPKMSERAKEAEKAEKARDLLEERPEGPLQRKPVTELPSTSGTRHPEQPVGTWDPSSDGVRDSFSMTLASMDETLDNMGLHETLDDTGFQADRRSETRQ